MVKKINTAYLNKNDNLSVVDSLEDYGGNYVDRLMEDNFMGIGIYSCPDFRLVRANKKYLNCMQGSSRLKDVGRDSLLFKVKTTKKTIYLEEIESVSSEDQIKYWNGTLTPIIKDEDVEIIIAAFREITDPTVRMKQLELKNEELKTATELQDEFLLMVTHDLKTPLAVIATTIQAIELCCENELSDRMIKYLDKIRQNTYRQMKLVNDILDNTRMNSGFFHLNLTKTDIIQLSKTIIESISIFAERKCIKISFQSSLSKLIIDTDTDLYERILLNLLSNAVKYTPQGKPVEGKIFRMEANNEQKICIQVKDSGIGIPIEKKDLIFERFGRVDELGGRFAGGTGIGLYLVKMLVSIIEGEIKLESKEGVGSIFSLILPAKGANTGTTPIDTVMMKTVNEHLIAPADIEFSDIYYG